MKGKLFDSHMHTQLCKHANGYLWEYVDHGWKAALDGVVFTCHCPMPHWFAEDNRMCPDELWNYIALVDEAADSAPNNFEVRLGLESEYFPGMEDWLKRLHGAAPFHFILGSVSWFLPEYQANFHRGGLWAFYCQYFDHLATAAESGLFDCLSHPDHVKGAFVEGWDPKHLQPVIENALDRIAATGIAMELDTSGYDNSVHQMYPGDEMLVMMRQRDIPVVLGSDAYQPEKVGGHFEAALQLLDRAGYTSVSSFENHHREEISILEAKSRLEDAVVSVA